MVAPRWGAPSMCRHDAQLEKIPFLPSAGIRQLTIAEQSKAAILWDLPVRGAAAANPR